MTKSKPLRGFAAMSPEQHRALASKGGKAVPSAKRTFSRDKDLAVSAGSKGGKALRRRKRR